MMWLTGFYAPLLPILIVVTIVALILCYWVDKVLLFNRYCRSTEISKDLNREMIELLEYYPLTIAIGNIFF